MLLRQKGAASINIISAIVKKFLKDCLTLLAHRTQGHNVLLSISGPQLILSLPVP